MMNEEQIQRVVKRLKKRGWTIQEPPPKKRRQKCGLARDCLFRFKVTAYERYMIDVAADKAGKDSASEWARTVLVELATKLCPELR